MNILVTGVLGFIGSHVARHFVMAGHHVHGVGRAYSKRTVARISDFEHAKNFNLSLMDLSGDISGLTERIEVVIHLAARTYVDHSILDPNPFIVSNFIVTHKLLEDARRYRPRLFIQVSTDEVYGPIAEGAFTEDAPLFPSNPYAATKASADLLGHAYWKTFALPVVIVRTTNNYGTWQHPQKAIPTFVREGLRDKPLPVFGDGQHRRRWIAVEDFCSALTIACELGQCGQIYHAGGVDEIENLQLAHWILEILGKPVDQIRFIPDKDARPGHDRRYALNSHKLGELGWKPQHILVNRLPQVVRWFQENRAWLDT